ncbi:hypothetical protein TIFTF001_013953 [Ficus carica]|uniref:Uncharacterized protein n=1 Tax=Ficus carica TaxID=3494 RepID=A0AA88A1W8_FICCA|nr:hypothetical protein TIFTF001_013953 [Ficus carica]
MVVTTAGWGTLWHQDCSVDFQPGECVHEQDIGRIPIVDQDTSDNVNGYIDFSDQCIVVQVEKLVGFIVSEGNWDAILAGDFRDVFSHVNVFPACYMLNITGVASPSTCRITCSCSPKNGMDNVLGLPGIGSVTRPWGSVWSDLAGFIGRTCRVLVLIPMGTVCPDRCLYEGVIGAILDLHDDLVKVVEKASDNCLNESIVPGISLRYHCRAVELLLEVVQLILIVRLDLWWSANRGISASTAVDPSSSQVVKHRGHAPRDVHYVILVLVLVISFLGSQGCGDRFLKVCSGS